VPVTTLLAREAHAAMKIFTSLITILVAVRSKFALSLTPAFRPVDPRHANANRFNGF
jgi:hypothetical protein